MLCAALFFGLGVWSLSSPSAKVFEHTTSTGEIRTIILTDGSKITLGGSTSLKSSFSDQSRQVTLNSGRAFFDVSPDIDRPFTVSAADTRIRVLGTSFDVAFRSEDVHVSVEHGRVDVSIIENGSVTDSSLLTDGMQISAAYTGVMGPKNNFDTNTLSWRQGQLAYVDTRLEDIVEEVNRYRTPSQKIKIADAALENLRVSFSVAADQTDTLLSGLEAILPIEVERSATGTTIIRASRED
ncbi:MAG: FecR domain-containing protein [Pseudomonadota bacterium]